MHQVEGRMKGLVPGEQLQQVEERLWDAEERPDMTERLV